MTYLYFIRYVHNDRGKRSLKGFFAGFTNICVTKRRTLRSNSPGVHMALDFGVHSGLHKLSFYKQEQTLFNDLRQVKKDNYINLIALN